MSDSTVVSFDSLLHAEDVSIFKTAIQDVLSKKEHTEVIFRFKEYPDKVKWEIIPAPNSEENYENLLLIGYTLLSNHTDTDIYKALIESEEKYSSVVSAIGEGLVVQDMNDRIIMCNQAAADILGLTLDQLKGKDSYDPQWQALKEDGTPFKPEEHPTMITLRTGQPVNNVLMNVHTGEGQRKYIIINSRPVLNHKKEMYGAVASFRDITAQKVAEQQLMKINQELLDYQQQLRKNLEELYASQAKVELQKKILEEECKHR
jgi:PAS domain S-box-containing protein